MKLSGIQHLALPSKQHSIKTTCHQNNMSSKQHSIKIKDLDNHSAIDDPILLSIPNQEVSLY